MRKRITSALLTLVMLLSLIPAMGTTAAAAGTGTINEYLYINREYKLDNGKYITKNAPKAPVAFDGKESSLPSDKTYAALYNDTLYLKGDWDGSVGIYGAMSVKRWLTNPLNIVVMGDTTIKRLELFWYNTAKENSGVTIDLHNNATLNITYATTGNGMSAIDAVYNKGDGTGWLGAAVTVKGTGTLKTNAVNKNWNQEPFTKAGTFSIMDNVNLDTKLVYTGDSDKEFYAYSLDKFIIDTTGYVKIDTSGYANALTLPELRPDAYQLKNASSITLTSSKKDKMYMGGAGDLVALFIERFCEGWNVEKPDNDNAAPYTLKLTRAGLSDAALTVGSQEIPRTGAVTEGEIQASSDNQSLSIKVNEPAWLKTLYNANRVDYNFTAAVYENGTKLSEDFALSWGGGTSTLGLTLRNGFKPTAGKSYIVTFSITPKVKATGDKLTDYAISGNWFLTAVEQHNEVIPSVTLTGDALTEGAASGPNLTSTDTSYTFTQSAWNPSGSIAAGKEYYTTLTLTAKEGYVFPTDWTQLRNIISVKLGGTRITKLGLGLANNGKTLSLTVYATADHVHNWSWKSDGENTHSQVCTGCDAKGNTETHTYTTTETTAAKITYTCTKCGKVITEDNDANKINSLWASVTAPKANVSAAGTWVTLENQYKEDAEITSAKWTEGDASAAAAADEFTGKFNAYKTYTLTVTFAAKGEKTFKNSWTGGPLLCLDGTRSTATVSTNGKTLTQSITFTIKMPVSVQVTLNNLAADGAIVPPTIESGKATGSMLAVNKGGTHYLYYYSNSTWTKLSTGDGEATPKLAAGESATLGLALLGDSDKEYIAQLQSTDNVNGLVAGAYAEKNGVYATYAVADETTAKTITSVELTVDAPEYDKTPATTATGADNAKYTVGTPTWSPTVTDNKFGADTYTVSIPVTAASNYSFAEGCIYTVNGYTATYDDTSKTVSYKFPELTVTCPHTHTEWKDIEGSGCCMEICSACHALIATMPHTLSANWETDDSKHSKKCIRCTYKTEGSHVESAQIIDTPADFNTNGSWHTECEVCGKQMNTGTIAKLKKIDTAAVTVTAPVRNGTPSDAATKDTTYGVTSTEWAPEVTGTFAGGTVYTVQVYLEATGSNRFTKDTKFTINGQTATVNPELSDGDYTDSIILTYQFPATGTGSSSSGSGSGSTTYTVKVLSSKNGSVTADRKTASAGTTVTLTVSPDKGYTLDDLTVLDKNGKEIKLTAKNGKYTFTMPASNVEVEATFKAAKSGNPFVDVPSGAYYEDAVIWAVKEGVTGGTSATTFNPNGICTRAQAVTFLWRAAGSPAPKSTAMPFTDVAQGSYYEQAVLWAVENGITKGTSDTTFSPNATCSRAQIVTFLWRSQKSPAAGSVNPFTDVSADAYYADAVLWAVKESVTSGTTATTFSPNADCTRAQIVTFIYRALAE